MRTISVGILPAPSGRDMESWRTDAGETAFAPFPRSTYFGDPNQQWMINFRVPDLDKMAAQLRANCAAVEVDPQVYPNSGSRTTKTPYR